MTDARKRAALLEATNHSNSLKLNEAQKGIFESFLYNQKNLNHISIQENVFYYALGRVLEINVHFSEDTFGHAENIKTEVRLVYRTEKGEVIIEDIEDIKADLELAPPNQKSNSIIVAFNYINESVPDAIEHSLNEVEEVFDVAEDVDSEEFYTALETANEIAKNEAVQEFEEMQRKRPTPHRERGEKRHKRESHHLKFEAASWTLSYDFFEALEEMNMKFAWDKALEDALANYQYELCRAIQDGYNKVKHKNLDIQKKMYESIQSQFIQAQ